MEPVESVRRTAPDRIADDGFIRIQNRELKQELLSLAESVCQQRMTWPRTGFVTAAINSTMA
jgi:hypothetical protein